MKTSAVPLAVILLGFCSAVAQLPPAQLRIDPPNTGPVRIELLGEAGMEYTIEAAEGLRTEGWSPLFTFLLPGDVQSLFDPGSLSVSRRFYRAVTLQHGPGRSQPPGHTDGDAAVKLNRRRELCHPKSSAARGWVSSRPQRSRV